jgi:hypothetical protein
VCLCEAAAVSEAAAWLCVQGQGQDGNPTGGGHGTWQHNTASNALARCREQAAAVSTLCGRQGHAPDGVTHSAHFVQLQTV